MILFRETISISESNVPPHMLLRRGHRLHSLGGAAIDPPTLHKFEDLRLVSSVWFKATLLGMFCGLGLLIGSWFGMSWIWDQIEQDMGTLRTLRQEIISAQSTLDELPKGVSYVKGKDGKGYILSRKMGTPFKTEAGEMAVEVR